MPQLIILPQAMSTLEVTQSVTMDGITQMQLWSAGGNLAQVGRATWLAVFSFFAEKNSSIGDLVHWSLGWLVPWSDSTNNQTFHNTSETSEASETTEIYDTSGKSEISETSKTSEASETILIIFDNLYNF